MSEKEPKKVGLIIGREWSWPSALIGEINRRDEGVVAEFVKLGGTFMEEACEYAVIIDRMSHEIPYYRAYLKYAALKGVYLVNDPFAWSADDKFFGVVLANELGLATPRTVILPNKRVETQAVPESFRNLEYPMNWQGVIDYVGVPAILKDAHTGGRRLAQRVANVDDLIEAYDESDTLTVIVQQILEADAHVHCFVIGREKVLPALYSLEEEVYLVDDGSVNDDARAQMVSGARSLCQAYGYDMNMVEFVIQEGTPYVINPTNPSPEMDVNLLKPAQFAWCVSEMADFAIDVAKNPRPQFANADWYKALSVL